MFATEQQAEVGRILVQECGTNLPFLEKADETALERVRFAVLKLSNGNISELRRAVALAKSDWRDALMAAGFGYSETEHKQWAQEVQRKGAA
jgi:hypothetical protein